MLDQSWLPNVTAGFLGVFAVRGFSANLYVGGDFTRVAQTKQLNFAQWTDNAVSASIDVGVSLADAPDPVDAGSSLDVHRERDERRARRGRRRRPHRQPPGLGDVR